MEIRGCLCCDHLRFVLEDTPGKDAASSFKCMRGVLHIKHATMYVGISALILSAFSAICLVLGVYTVNFWLDVFLIILNTVVAVLLLTGLWIESAPLLVPFIVAETAQCAGFFMLACYVFYFMLNIKQPFLRKFDQMLMVVSILIGIVVASSAVWATAKCYHYLRSLERGEDKEKLAAGQWKLPTPEISPDYPWAFGAAHPLSSSLSTNLSTRRHIDRSRPIYFPNLYSNSGNGQIPSSMTPNASSECSAKRQQQRQILPSRISSASTKTMTNGHVSTGGHERQSDKPNGHPLWPHSLSTPSSHRPTEHRPPVRAFPISGPLTTALTHSHIPSLCNSTRDKYLQAREREAFRLANSPSPYVNVTDSDVERLTQSFYVPLSLPNSQSSCRMSQSTNSPW